MILKEWYKKDFLVHGKHGKAGHYKINASNKLSY
jgi:hypothetical protein